jgi:hypothetical protein
MRFGLPVPLPGEITREIKRADRVAAFYEATRLAGFSREEAFVYFNHPEKIDSDMTQRLMALSPLPAADAQQLFLERFSILSGTR